MGLYSSALLNVLVLTNRSSASRDHLWGERQTFTVHLGVLIKLWWTPPLFTPQKAQTSTISYIYSRFPCQSMLQFYLTLCWLCGRASFVSEALSDHTTRGDISIQPEKHPRGLNRCSEDGTWYLKWSFLHYVNEPLWSWKAGLLSLQEAPLMLAHSCDVKDAEAENSQTLPFSCKNWLFSQTELIN